MKNKIKVIIKEVGKDPKVTEIDNSIENFQKLVDGYVQHILLSNEVGCWLNDNGKLEDLPFNVNLADCNGKIFDALVGNLFLVQEDEECKSDLTDENIEKYLKQLREKTLRCEQVDLLNFVY